MSTDIVSEAVFRPRLVCEVCLRSYKTQRDLRRHQTYECNKEPQFQCPYCPYKAKLKNTLKTHVIAKHCGPYIGDGSKSD